MTGWLMWAVGVSSGISLAACVTLLALGHGLRLRHLHNVAGVVALHSAAQLCWLLMMLLPHQSLGATELLSIEVIALALGALSLTTYWRHLTGGKLPRTHTRVQWLLFLAGLLLVYPFWSSVLSYGPVLARWPLAEALLALLLAYAIHAQHWRLSRTEHRPWWMPWLWYSFSLLWGIQLLSLPLRQALNLPELPGTVPVICWLLGLLAFCSSVPFVVSRSIVRKEDQHKQALLELESEVSKRTQDLKETTERSNRFAALQRDFLATMSHELRTPISSLVGLCRLLAADEQLTQRVRRDLGTMERLALMVLEMVDEGLSYVRQRDNPLPLQTRRVNMRVLLRDLESVGRWLAYQQGNRFNLLPVKTMPATLELDERRLRQIVINLLSNAGNYCHKGEITLGLEAQLSGNTCHLEWVISDTGRGMSEEELRRVFEPFVKSRDSHGMGLGLALVKRLVEEINGSIKVQSSPGMGTYFLVRLPAQLALGSGEDPPDSSMGTDKDSPSQSVAPITEPMALMDEAEVGFLELDGLKRFAKLGQLSEIERWIRLNKTRHLSSEAHRFIDRVECAVQDVDLEKVGQIITQAQTSATRRSPPVEARALP
jgi:signal transduction histidine kinase